MSLPSVRLYNTFSRRKEELRPLQEGVVRIYSCGPTVYRYAHVGNLRTFMLPDLLCRSLEYLGYRTEQVMNVTDVGHLTDDTFDRGEDKMLVAARLESKSTEEIAAYYTGAFMEDIRKVGIRPDADLADVLHERTGVVGGDLLRRFALEPRRHQHLVFATVEGVVSQVADVGDIHDLLGAVAQVLEAPAQEVGQHEGPQVAHVHVAVHRGTARVDADHAFAKRCQLLLRPREGVV